MLGFQLSRSTVTLSVGSKWTMRDLICDVNYCALAVKL